MHVRGGPAPHTLPDGGKQRRECQRTRAYTLAGGNARAAKMAWSNTVEFCPREAILGDSDVRCAAFASATMKCTRRRERKIIFRLLSLYFTVGIGFRLSRLSPAPSHPTATRSAALDSAAKSRSKSHAAI